MHPLTASPHIHLRVELSVWVDVGKTTITVQAKREEKHAEEIIWAIWGGDELYEIRFTDALHPSSARTFFTVAAS